MNNADMRVRENISFKLRLKIYMRDNFMCVYCKKGMNPLSEDLCLDHVNPEGLTVEENLVVACRSCNSIKGSRTPQEIAKEFVGKKVSLNGLLGRAAKKFECSVDALRRKNNSTRFVVARLWFYQEARKCGHSMPEIGRSVNKHHTTVLHHLKKASTEETTGFSTETSQDKQA